MMRSRRPDRCCRGRCADGGYGQCGGRLLLRAGKVRQVPWDHLGVRVQADPDHFAKFNLAIPVGNAAATVVEPSPRLATSMTVMSRLLQGIV
jgi:hypothetical protein